MPRIASATCSITQQVTQYNPVRVEVTIEREGDESNESITDMAVAQAEIMLTTALLTRARRRTGENVTQAPVRTLRETFEASSSADNRPIEVLNEDGTTRVVSGAEAWVIRNSNEPAIIAGSGVFTRRLPTTDDIHQAESRIHRQGQTPVPTEVVRPPNEREILEAMEPTLVRRVVGEGPIAEQLRGVLEGPQPVQRRRRRPPQVERLMDTAAQSQMLQEDTEIPNLPVAGTEPEESER